MTKYTQFLDKFKTEKHVYLNEIADNPAPDPCKRVDSVARALRGANADLRHYRDKVKDALYEVEKGDMSHPEFMELIDTYFHLTIIARVGQTEYDKALKEHQNVHVRGN